MKPGEKTLDMSIYLHAIKKVTFIHHHHQSPPQKKTTKKKILALPPLLVFTLLLYILPNLTKFVYYLQASFLDLAAFSLFIAIVSVTYWFVGLCTDTEYVLSYKGYHTYTPISPPVVIFFVFSSVLLGYKSILVSPPRV